MNIGSIICVYGHICSNILYNIITKNNNMTIYIILSLLLITSKHYFIIIILFTLYYINIYGGLLMSSIYITSIISSFNIIQILLLCFIMHIITFVFYDNYKPIIIKEINENYIESFIVKNNENNIINELDYIMIDCYK